QYVIRRLCRIALQYVSAVGDLDLSRSSCSYLAIRPPIQNDGDQLTIQLIDAAKILSSSPAGARQIESDQAMVRQAVVHGSIAKESEVIASRAALYNSSDCGGENEFESGIDSFKTIRRDFRCARTGSRSGERRSSAGRRTPRCGPRCLQVRELPRIHQA